LPITEYCVLPMSVNGLLGWQSVGHLSTYHVVRRTWRRSCFSGNRGDQ